MKYLDFLRLWFTAEEGNGESGNGNDAGKGSDGNDGDNGGKDTDDKDTPKYSQNDVDKMVDKIVAKRFARWKAQEKASNDEAARLATMTAQERAEHERDKLQAELDDLKHKAVIADMEKTARGILTEDGIIVPDSIISHLVDEDAEQTAENVKVFAKAFKEAVADEVKRKLSHKTPAGGKGAGTITKAEIMKESDPIKRQKLIRDNMSLFR